MKVKINKHNNLLYVLLIPYLYPRGFQSFFDGYKTFFTVWLFLTMAIVAILFLHRIIRNKLIVKRCIILMLVYFFAFIVITLLCQGGIHDGLQKLFVAPTMCMLCAMYLQDKTKNLIDCLSNILIMNFGLNITLFGPLLWPVYFNENTHINFIGHVQTASQWGVLGALVSYILHIYGEKNKSKILLALSLITMTVSEATAAYISVVFLVIFYFIYKKMKITRKFIERLFLSSGKILTLFLALNLLIFWMVNTYSYGNINYIMTLLSNGRTFVWREVFELIGQKFYLGYGAYGVLIKVFWSNEAGMNYAHNEVLQQMLNGGIVLTILFLVMIFSYTKNISIKNNGRIDYWPYACLFIMIIIMLFESVTEYFYFFMLLTIIGYWQEIKANGMKGNRYGANH